MNNGNLNIDNKTCIDGTCLDMCPPEEINLRRREKMVHILEVTEEGYKLVKCFSRSAANSNMAVPRHLRPYPTLLATTQHLLLNVSKRKDVKMAVMYDFLNDRLRAVRQDMTIQRIHPKECVTLLEPMIRFYAYYGYRLCEYSISEFDPVLNKKYLLECIKWFLSCADTLEETKHLESITHTMKSLNICGNNMLACDRSLVESLYMVCNLFDEHPLYRYLSLPDYLKRVSALRLAYDVAVANMLGNYVKVWRLSKRLCPLTFAAFCIYLPTMQKRGLQIMSSAYNSKQLSVPTKVLQQWLGFNSEEQVRSMCHYYGLSATDVVSFNKNLFKQDAEVTPPTQHYMARISKLELVDLLSYTI